MDNYYQLEENVAKQTKGQVLELIKDNEGKGNDPADKLRFFIICKSKKPPHTARYVC